MRADFSLFVLAISLIMLFSCTSDKKENGEQNEEVGRREVSDDQIVGDTVINNITDSPVSIEEEEDDPYSINYLEDFAKFQSHEQIENYFGLDKVKFEIVSYGPGEFPTSFIYVGYENQICVTWQYETANTFSFGSVMTSGRMFEYEDLKPGGNTYAFKYGLKDGMSLQELIEINEGPVEFYDLAFSLARESHYGMIIQSSLKPDLQNYLIFLSYNKPEGAADYPADYYYLQQEKTVWSNNDSVNVSALYVRSLEYSPY